MHACVRISRLHRVFLQTFQNQILIVHVALTSCIETVCCFHIYNRQETWQYSKDSMYYHEGIFGTNLHLERLCMSLQNKACTLDFPWKKNHFQLN
jgi:hypothetical protein